MWEFNGEVSRDIFYFDGMRQTFFYFFFGEMGGILLRVDMEIVAIFFTFQLLRKATKNVITCVLLTWYWCTDTDLDN